MKSVLLDPKYLVSIHDGREGEKIVQINDDGSTFDVAPPLYWIEAEDWVTPWHVYINGEFVYMYKEEIPEIKEPDNPIIEL